MKHRDVQKQCEARVGGRMKMSAKKTTAILVMALAAATLSCSNDLNKSASPVELIMTSTQILNRIDLLPSAANCDQNAVLVEIRARLKNPAGNVNQQFNDVKLTSYHVSYIRTDGGTQVPAPYSRSINVLLEATDQPDDVGWSMSTAGMAKMFGTEDFNEGLQAFVQKRAPQWKGK